MLAATWDCVRDGKFRLEPAADVHQQVRRSVSANLAGAGCALHSGPFWSGQRSSPLGWPSAAARAERNELNIGPSFATFPSPAPHSAVCQLSACDDGNVPKSGL